MLTLIATTEMSSMGNGVSLNSGGKSNFATTKHTHPNGYTWTAAEDEPGYLWMSKKAQDDYKRASDQMVHKDNMIKSE